MQKVTVSKEVSDRERNRRVSEKRDFLTPKRNSSSSSIYHLDWTDLFLSASSMENTCWLGPEA